MVLNHITADSRAVVAPVGVCTRFAVDEVVGVVEAVCVFEAGVVRAAAGADGGAGVARGVCCREFAVRVVAGLRHDGLEKWFDVTIDGKGGSSERLKREN